MGVFVFSVLVCCLYFKFNFLSYFYGNLCVFSFAEFKKLMCS